MSKVPVRWAPLLLIAALAPAPEFASSSEPSRLASPARRLQDDAYWAPLRNLAHSNTEDFPRTLRGVKTRVMVEFDIEGVSKEVALDLLRVAKSDLRDRLRRSDDESVQDFAPLPFLALDISERELRLINDLKVQFIPGEEPVRIRVEVSPVLRGGATSVRKIQATGGVQQLSVVDLVTKLGASGIGLTGETSRIVVIDEGVDPENPSMTGTVVDGALVMSQAVCIAGEGVEANPHAGKDPDSDPGVLDHGTMVASIAAWVAPQAEFVSLRVGGGSGALLPNVIAALTEVGCRWNTDSVPIASVVLSMTNENVTKDTHPTHYKSMQETICKLWKAGVPVVVSAGNTGPRPDAVFPANLEHAISVSGVRNNLLERADGSNWNKEIDICAPGFQVAIPYPGKEWPSVESGTSVSAPFVAGAIALLKGEHPNCTNVSVVDALLLSGKPIPDGDMGVTVPLLQVRAALSELNVSCVQKDSESTSTEEGSIAEEQTDHSECGDD